MADRKMILGRGLTDGYGNLAGAWRAPHVDADNYARIEANIRYAQAAGRGGFTFFFTPDFPAVRADVEHSTISHTLDPMMHLAAISQAASCVSRACEERATVPA